MKIIHTHREQIMLRSESSNQKTVHLARNVCKFWHYCHRTGTGQSVPLLHMQSCQEGLKRPLWLWGESWVPCEHDSTKLAQNCPWLTSKKGNYYLVQATVILSFCQYFCNLIPHNTRPHCKEHCMSSLRSTLLNHF